MTRRVAAVVMAALWTGGLAPPAAADHGVSLQGVRYVPAGVTIRAGESVTWTHRDSGLFHHVGADDGTWDSSPTCGHPGGQCMRGGDTYTHVFLQPGTFGYHCRLHGQPGRGMAGTVRVLGR
jgi:plastocyanin